MTPLAIDPAAAGPASFGNAAVGPTPGFDQALSIAGAPPLVASAPPLPVVVPSVASSTTAALVLPLLTAASIPVARQAAAPRPLARVQASFDVIEPVVPSPPPLAAPAPVEPAAAAIILQASAPPSRLAGAEPGPSNLAIAPRPVANDTPSLPTPAPILSSSATKSSVSTEVRSEPEAESDAVSDEVVALPILPVPMAPPPQPISATFTPELPPPSFAPRTVAAVQTVASGPAAADEIIGEAPDQPSSAAFGAPVTAGTTPAQADQANARVAPSDRPRIASKPRREGMAATASADASVSGHSTARAGAVAGPASPPPSASPFTLASAGDAPAPTPVLGEARALAQPGRIGHDTAIAIVRHVGAGGGGVLTVRLDPEHMGRVEVRLGFDDSGTLRAVMTADSPAALDLLRRDQADLTRALTDAGVSADARSFTFDSRGDSRGDGRSGGDTSRQRPSSPAGRLDTFDPASAAAPARPHPSRLALGRVDVTA